jgi:L-2-hydroxyglutarate oxidase LhgO
MPDVALSVDAVVIGAGVVGLASARELAERGHEVLIIERHERFGVETSSRNSEVVHAGIHYPPGSLKATLCVEGNRALYAWCAAHDVPHRRLGKVVVAAAPEEEAALEAIRARAETCGVTSLEPLTAAGVRRLEPMVRARAGLWSPDTGIVDTHALMASLLADAEGRGTMVAWRHTLAAAERTDGGYTLVARDDDGEETTFGARMVVNAAGLDADRVAALPGLDAAACGYTLTYARGRYFRVHARKSHLATHLIYPTPVEAGLGIHVTLDLSGCLRLGPDVEWMEHRRQEYAVDPVLAPRFHAAVSRFLEGLDLDDLAPDQAGIRPKLQRPGEAFRDFVVAEECAHGLPGWLNLVGIESPGLTAALAIAAHAADLLEETA